MFRPLRVVASYAPRCQQLTKAIEKVVVTARRACLPPGVPAAGAEEAPARLKQGLAFPHLGVESVSLEPTCKESCQAAGAVAAEDLRTVPKSQLPPDINAMAFSRRSCRIDY